MYENYILDQAVFYYLYRFVIPLLIAEIITFAYVRKKSYWGLRLLGYFALFVSFSIIIIYWNVDIKIGWFRTIFLFIFALSLVPLYLTYSLKFKQLLFLALSAYTIQNFSDNLWQLIMMFFFNPSKGLEIGLLGITLLVTYSAYFFIFIKLVKKNDIVDLNNTVVVLMSSIAVLVVNILSMYGQQNSDTVALISIRIYALIACFFILAVQYNIFHARKLSDEKSLLEQTLKFQNEKFASSKETMELINIKCHDLKHEIESIKDTCSTTEQIKRLNDLRKTVDIYDSAIKTGNPVLDMVLSEKTLVCKKNKIRIVPIIDGSLLSFMDNSDIYSLFENALDNAIKAVKVEKEKCRSIFIKVIQKGDIVSIKVENYCSKNIEFENGLPKSKEDNRYHGFGTKSIEYIVKKYDGNVSFKLENHVFSLVACFFN